MVGTLLSLIIGALILLVPPKEGLLLPLPTVALTMITLSLIYTIAAITIYIASWSPLQKIEQNLTPRLAELFKKDKSLALSSSWLFAFPLITLLIAAEITYFRIFRPPFCFALWTLLFGISSDALLQLLRRVLSFLNPFLAVDHFAKHGIAAAMKNDNVELLKSIDTLAEIAIKAINRTLPSLASEAIDNIQEVAHAYIERCKSTLNKKEESEEECDTISYTLFYFYQRLEAINEKATESRIVQLTTQLVTTLGKIAIDSAHFDIYTASYPVHYIGKCTRLAQENSLDEVTERATCTLVEVARIIVEEVELDYADIKELFFTINKQLEEFAKEQFSRDKSINIALLTQPFRELKELFAQKKLATHQDQHLIKTDIERVINQFEQLELVMRTIPPIQLPDEEELEEESLGKES